MKLLAIPFVPNQLILLMQPQRLQTKWSFLALSFQQIFHSHKGFDKHNNTIPFIAVKRAQICYDSRSRYFRKTICEIAAKSSLGFHFPQLLLYVKSTYRFEGQLTV